MSDLFDMADVAMAVEADEAVQEIQYYQQAQEELYFDAARIVRKAMVQPITEDEAHLLCYAVGLDRSEVFSTPRRQA